MDDAKYIRLSSIVENKRPVSLRLKSGHTAMLTFYADHVPLYRTQKGVIWE